jgi:hypothetical protein
MKFKHFIVLLTLFSFITATAQVMNVRKWRKTEKDSLENAMYLIDETQYVDALPIFEVLLKGHPKEEFLRYTYAKCALYRSDKHADSYQYLSELYQKNNKVPEIQFDMALASHYNYKFDEATNLTNTFLANKRLTPEQKRSAEMLLVYIGNARRLYNTPTPARLKNLGPGINTADDEYVPAITANESRMIYTYRGAKSVGGLQNQFLQPDPYGIYTEDIYQTMREGADFKTSKAVTSLNTNAGDAAISMSNDGRILFVYKDGDDGHGDIYFSTFLGDSFSAPEKLKGEINSYSWDGHCSLSPDGKTLYFSSERGGGFGGRDLYKVTLQADSTWGNAVNLGDSINTPYDEDAPFFHPDGRSLYYSSKGMASMGGYDVFRAVLSPKDSLFRRGQNLGYPINSTADDRYFVLTADSKRGYYSTARSDGFGKSDIYMIEPNFVEAPEPLYLVRGRTTDKTKPVQAQIRVQVITEHNRVFNYAQSNPITGDYLVCLPMGVDYKLVYSMNGRDTIFLEVAAKQLDGFTEKVNNIDFTIPPSAEVVDLATKTPSTPAVAAVTGSPKPVTTTSNLGTKTVEPLPVGSVPIAATTKTVAATTKTVAPVAAVSKTMAATNPTVAAVSKTMTPVTTLANVETKTVAPAPVVSKTTAPVAVVTKTVEPVLALATKTTAAVKPLPPVPTPTPEPVVAVTKTVAPAKQEPLALENKNEESDLKSDPQRLNDIKVPDEMESPRAALLRDPSFPATPLQEKTLRYVLKYGEISAPGLEFRVQLSAVKKNHNKVFPNHTALGRMENLSLGDGYIRITFGGPFKTIGEAFEHNRTTAYYGQKEGFVIAIYQGKRVSYNYLEEIGIFKKAE